MTMYKLLESDGQGYFNLHTDWLTKKEAEEMRNHHAKTFPNQDWIIEPHRDEERHKVVRYTPRDAADGWEDIYPDRENY